MSNSNWITAAGETPDGDTNLTPEAQRGQATAVVGGRGLETRTAPNGESYILENRNQGYTNGADEGFQGSVIATARTEGGSLIMSRPPTVSDRVTLPNGMTTNISAAIHAGYLTRNSDGSFSDVKTPETLKNPADTAPFGKPQETPEGGADEAEKQDEVFTIGEEGEEALTSIFQSVPQGDIVRATDEILQLGGVSDNTLARMASIAGIEPEAMAAQIATAHQGFYDTASAHLEKHGVVNDEGFQAYLSDHPQQMRALIEASRGLLSSSHANVLGGLTDVAASFVENGDTYMPEEVKAALDEAGFSYEMGVNGRLMVKIDGYPVPWNVAVRQGLIKFL